jgi:hypothetical protein
MQASNTPTYTGSPCDVFVSYSHGDPKGTGRGPLANWTHRLIDELRNDIDAVSIEFDQLRLWDDRETDPTRQLTKAIRDYVADSALLLIVMTPRYLASAWCRDELNWFNSELRRRSADEGCTFVVRALPTDEKQWPDALKDERGNSILGFWFHPRPAKESVRAFGWPDPKSSDREFFEALSSLSTGLMQRLRKLKQRALLRESAIHAYTSSLGGHKIYLHGREDDAEMWERIRDQLINNGFSVLPDSLNDDANGLQGLRRAQELRRKRIDAYAKCDAVLVLRARPGDWIYEELEAIGFDELRDLDAFHQKQIRCGVLDVVNDGELGDLGFQIQLFPTDVNWIARVSSWLRTSPILVSN